MYILLEDVTCVVLVTVAVATLLAVGSAFVTLVQFLYRAALWIGHLWRRRSVVPLRLGSPLFKYGGNLVAVKVSAREE